MPAIPQLASQLIDDRLSIVRALQNAFEAHDADPSIVDPIDWNKTERHTIAGFLIHQQMEYLVEGRGPEAQFKSFPAPSGLENIKVFRQSLGKVLDTGATYVEDTYSSGSDPEHGWWPQAARRYRRLGYGAFFKGIRRGLKMEDYSLPATVPREGVSLRKALRTKALGSAIETQSRLIINGLESTKEERLRAARDVAYLAIGFSGLHVLEFFMSRLIDVDIVMNEDTGHYEPVYENRSDRRKLYPRLRGLPNVTLKCPAHVAWRSGDVSAGDSRGSTSLQNLFYAALNATQGYDIF